MNMYETLNQFAQNYWGAELLILVVLVAILLCIAMKGLHDKIECMKEEYHYKTEAYKESLRQEGHRAEYKAQEEREAAKREAKYKEEKDENERLAKLYQFDSISMKTLLRDFYNNKLSHQEEHFISSNFIRYAGSTNDGAFGDAWRMFWAEAEQIRGYRLRGVGIDVEQTLDNLLAAHLPYIKAEAESFVRAKAEEVSVCVEYVKPKKQQ